MGSGALHVRLHDAGARPEAERVRAATLGASVERDADPAALTARGATPDRIALGLAELVNAGLTVEEFALGQPSLDEVFLSLTGHPAEPGVYLFATATPAALLVEITTWALRRGVAIRGLSVGAESLEEIYLRLTGAAMRD